MQIPICRSTATPVWAKYCIAKIAQQRLNNKDCKTRIAQQRVRRNTGWGPRAGIVVTQWVAVRASRAPIKIPPYFNPGEHFPRVHLC